jgi:hypothetical protein
VAFDLFEQAYAQEAAGGKIGGDILRALASGQRLPHVGDPYDLTLRPESLEDEVVLGSRVYWCRYENAFGDTWEARNAWLPELELPIQPIAVVRRYVPNSHPKSGSFPAKVEIVEHYVRRGRTQAASVNLRVPTVGVHDMHRSVSPLILDSWQRWNDRWERSGIGLLTRSPNTYRQRRIVS